MSTLLLIDDSERHRAQLRAAVDAAGLFDAVIEAENGMTELRVVLEKQVDVVVARMELSGLDGTKLLPALKAHPAGAAVPLVFLTPHDDASRRARILAAGASDVLTMPVHPEEFAERLRGHLQRKRLQDDLRVKNETLARLSTVDGLTGLRTRRYIDDVLSIEFLRAKRYKTPLSILMGDIDLFKNVNDQYGHLAGDAALRGVASVVLHDLRETDVAGRYGGEEIMVVLAQNEISGSRIVAERWRKAVEESRFATAAGQAFGVTLSVGAASLEREMESPEALIGAADAALYRAKDRGRNRVEIAGPA